MRVTAIVVSLAALILAPTAAANQQTIDTPMEFAALKGALKGTPQTHTHQTVLHHQRKAKETARKGFKAITPGQHSFNKKRWYKHRDALKDIDRRKALTKHKENKKKAWKKFSAAPWSAWYKGLGATRINSLDWLAVCENSGRNHPTYGYHGWLGWRHLPGLLPDHMRPFVKLPMGANSQKAQYVMTSAVFDRYGRGGWPSCSSRHPLP